MKKTIIDVAKALNLAPSTVSKVVNQKGSVSQATRARVLAYVKEIGYVADNSARILKSKKSWTIGVIYSDISLIGFEHPFFSRILQSFKSTVEKEGYDIVLIVSKLGKNELTYLEWCKNKKVDGVLIVMGNINNPNIIEVVNSDFPVVSTDIVMPNLSSIISDDEMGVKIAIDFAQRNLAKHITLLSGPVTSRSFVKRIETFRNEMVLRNLPFNESDILIAEGFGDQSGYKKALEMIDSFQSLPDFLFVCSDQLAFGVIRALESRKINVPNDIAVMGYDDIDFSKHFYPALTTIRQDTQAIGEQAAQRLLHFIKTGKPNQSQTYYVPVELIERDSTKKIKQQKD